MVKIVPRLLKDKLSKLSEEKLRIKERGRFERRKIHKDIDE